MKHLPERTEPEPFEMLTPVEQDPSDVAEAFPEDAPVETCNLPVPEDSNLPDPEESNLPDREKSNLSDPEESNLPAGQKPRNLSGEDLNSVHSPTQTTLESNERTCGSN